MGLGPRQPVADPRPREQTTGSLLRAAPPVEDPTLRFEGGIAYREHPCSAGAVFDPCVAGTKEPEEQRDPVEADPVGIYVGESCSAFGFTEANYVERARARLEACQSSLIAAELWGGALTQGVGATVVNHWLTEQPTPGEPWTLDVLDSGADAAEALGCLEQMLVGVCTVNQAMIHTTPQVVTLWRQENLVEREASGILRTVMGTLVVADYGYPGTGPAGPPDHSDETGWAFITALPHVRLSDVVVYPDTLLEALDRTLNTVTFYAERLALVQLDSLCVHAGIGIDVPECAFGEGS